MATLEELIAQKDAIEKQIKAVRETEIKNAIAEAKEIIARYDLTEKDLFGKMAVVKLASKVAVKYKNPQTGETWTGRGRSPKWLEGKKKEDFAV